MNKPFDMYSWRKKYIYLAENDSQYPDYNPETHKTLMRGAVDLELQGNNVVMYLPFEEEAPNAVAYRVPVSELESKLNLEIDSQEDLDAAYDDIYTWLHNKWSGPFGSYHKTPHGKSSMTEGPEDVDAAYSDVLALIRKKARMLNDDDAYKFHELLKGFFNRLLQEDHTKKPGDKYKVKRCNKEGEPWAVWEGSKRIKGFKTREEAEAYANKENKSQNLTEAKGIYFVRVSLRDALKAQRLVDDMYRNIGVMIRGEEFLSADPQIMYDLIMDFGAHDIEIEDSNLDFSDYDGDSSSEDMLDLYERYLKED